MVAHTAFVTCATTIVFMHAAEEEVSKRATLARLAKGAQLRPFLIDEGGSRPGM